jgi:hypothetical protein
VPSWGHEALPDEVEPFRYALELTLDPERWPEFRDWKIFVGFSIPNGFVGFHWCHRLHGEMSWIAAWVKNAVFCIFLPGQAPSVARWALVWMWPERPPASSSTHLGLSEEPTDSLRSKRGFHWNRLAILAPTQPLKSMHDMPIRDTHVQARF